MEVEEPGEEELQLQVKLAELQLRQEAGEGDADSQDVGEDGELISIDQAYDACKLQIEALAAAHEAKAQCVLSFTQLLPCDVSHASTIVPRPAYCCSTPLWRCSCATTTLVDCPGPFRASVFESCCPCSAVQIASSTGRGQTQARALQHFLAVK